MRSAPPHLPRRPMAEGFTLVELSIALAVAAVMFAAAVVGLGALTGTQARGAAGELGGVIRALYDTAALTGRTCRLVFELPKKRDEGARGPRYWAECASGSLTASRDREQDRRRAPDERRERDDERRRERAERRASPGSTSLQDAPSLEELLAVEKDRVESLSRFAEFTSPEVERRELSGQVRLSVWTRHQREPIEEGLAFLYFFPQGFTERAQIILRQGRNAWTLTVAPLTGKTAVVPEVLEVPTS